MEHGRLMVDSAGVEWEVYDESQWTVAFALECEYAPQPANPALLFNSAVGRRRMFPCPAAWKSLSDGELEVLLRKATSLS